MENKINIAKLLKDCPKGMELNCTTWENVTFEKVVNDLIYVKRNNKDAPFFDKIIVLNKYGCCTDHKDEKCRIFPKDKNTWEGFHRPFKDGDIISNGTFIAIFCKTDRPDTSFIRDVLYYRCWYNCRYNTFKAKIDFGIGSIDGYRLATEEETQKFFDAIKANGYRWNPETKKLEELIEPEFKDGDILATDLGSVFYLNTRLNTDECYGCYVGIGGDNSFHICEPFAYKECCGLATKKEKEKLFQAIKENGYKWNQETKTLEKLPKFKVGNKIKYKDTILTIIDVQTNNYIVEDEPDHFGILMFSQQDKWELINEPKFKVGDRVKHIPTSTSGIVVHVDNKGYYIDYHNVKGICYTSFILENDYELMPNKFDINTLKPFESKVLVRNKNHYKWEGAVFGRYDGNTFFTIGGADWRYCIPYKGNEHLFGNTDDCNDYFKTWEK